MVVKRLISRVVSIGRAGQEECEHGGGIGMGALPLSYRRAEKIRRVGFEPTTSSVTGITEILERALLSALAGEQQNGGRGGTRTHGRGFGDRCFCL